MTAPTGLPLLAKLNEATGSLTVVSRRSYRSSVRQRPRKALRCRPQQPRSCLKRRYCQSDSLEGHELGV